MNAAQSVYDFVVPELDGTDCALNVYQGRVLLIANTSSKNGSQGKLRKLYKLQEVFRTRPFSVLAFPNNLLIHNEKNTNALIRESYIERHGYTFKVFGKVKVNGEDAHPLFKWLKRKKRGPLGKAITENFTYFLVESDGQTVHRYTSTTKWSKLAWKIEQAIRVEEKKRNQTYGDPLLGQRIAALDVVDSYPDEIMVASPEGMDLETVENPCEEEDIIRPGESDEIIMVAPQLQTVDVPKTPVSPSSVVWQETITPTRQT